MRRHAVSLVLVAAAVALALWVLLVEGGGVTSSEREHRKRNVFQAFRRNDLSAIEIDGPGGALRLERRPEGDASPSEGMWWVAAPAAELADQTAVDTLISALEFAVPERRLARDFDRAASGLATPRIRLVVRMGTLVHRLAVGAPAPSPPGAAYGDLEGEGPVVLGRDLVTQLERPANHYRSRTLIPYLSSDLAEIVLDGPGGRRRLTRGPWGGWRIDRGDGDTAGPRVDRDVLDRVLAAFPDVRAESFLPAADAEAAMGQAPLSIVLVPRAADRPRLTMRIGGPCPGRPEDVVAVRSEPSRIAACVPRGVLPALSTPADDLADRHLFGLRPDEMAEIAVAGDGARLDLARKEAGWRMRAPSPADVDAEAGNAFARNLAEWTAVRFAPAGAGAAFVARTTVTVTRASEGQDDARAAETVEVAAPAGTGAAVARRLQDGALVEIDPDVARAMAPSPLAVRGRKVIDESPLRLRSVIVRSAGADQTLRRGADRAWTLEEPALPVDSAIANDLAESLARLRADRWVADRDDGSFGLGDPRARVDLDFGDAATPEGAAGDAAPAGSIDEGARRTERLLVGAPTAGGAFARREGDPAVFVLPRAVETAFRTWAVDRSLPSIDATAFARVEIRGEGRKVVLRASGRDLRAEEPASLGPGRVEALRERLGQLRAEGVVRIGPPGKDDGVDRPLLEIVARRPADAGARDAEVRIAFGRGDAWRGTSVFYARRSGVPATFAVAQGRVRAVVDAM